MLSRLANDLPTEAEITKLNDMGLYVQSYHRCELFLIYHANGIEWHDDNGWWKVKDSIESEDKKSSTDVENKRRPSLYLMFLFSVASFYTGNHHRAYYFQYRLLNSPFTDDEDVCYRVKSNMHFSIEKIKSRLSFYPEDIISDIMERHKGGEKKGIVTLTMTTCKRLDLFIRTMNSFLNACKDIAMIDRFFIVDDNSSPEDRQIMKNMYPFVELYEKKPNEIGHPISLNIIMEKVTTPYVLHLEDDHEFFCRRNYIKPSLKILEEREDIGQVLFNENYMEIPRDLCIIGGSKLERDKKNRKYLSHIYYERDTEEYYNFFKSLKPGIMTNTHWPHYSLRPSLTKVKALHHVGEFKKEVEFERRYAERYTKLGYKSAFLLGLHHIHIGRTSHELNAGLNVENAYTLNNTRQWGY